MIYLGCLLETTLLDVVRLRAGGEELLLEHHAELFPDALQLLEVLVVLALVLDLGVDACAVVLVCAPGCACGPGHCDVAIGGKRTLEYPDGGGKVVDAPGGSEGSDDDAGRGNEIVGESVVEVTLQLEDVLDVLELLLVSARARVSKSVMSIDIITSQNSTASFVSERPRDFAELS